MDGFLKHGLVSAAHHILRILQPFFAWLKRRDPALPSNLLADLKLPKEHPEQERLWEDVIAKFGLALQNCDYTQKWNVLF